MTRIAVIGSKGQVAEALVRRAAQQGCDLHARGRPLVDLTDIATLGRFLDDVRPAVVVNAAAYTAVDKAESEPQAAFALNAEAAGRLAAVCSALGIPLIHISTDYVFDGTATAPYCEDHPQSPINVYGASKAAGETAVRMASTDCVILRTSWVYGRSGHNFVRTMLRLGAERDELTVVADQTGAPTFADDIADAVLSIAGRLAADRDPALRGVFHFTAAGATTWHGFAEAVFATTAALDPSRNIPRVRPIATADYPTPARRPPYSVLDCGRIEDLYGIGRPDWRDALGRAMPAILADQL